MKIIKDILGSTLIVALVAMATFIAYEPNVSQAVEDQIVVTQLVTGEITISSPSNVTMSPSIVGTTGNPGSPSTGYASWTIITNNVSGFTATLRASSTTMIGNVNGDIIDAYTAATAGVPDYTWDVPSGNAEFGYNATTTTAADLHQSFRNNGTACNDGALMTTNNCWLAASTTAKILINRTTPTLVGGVILGLKFQVELDGHSVTADTYVATTTVTATTN